MTYKSCSTREEFLQSQQKRWTESVLKVSFVEAALPLLAVGSQWNQCNPCVHEAQKRPLSPLSPCCHQSLAVDCWSGGWATQRNRALLVKLFLVDGWKQSCLYSFAGFFPLRHTFSWLQPKAFLNAWRWVSSCLSSQHQWAPQEVAQIICSLWPRKSEAFPSFLPLQQHLLFPAVGRPR